jgi:tetratricopeptide (TPR) repeat protein
MASFRMTGKRAVFSVLPVLLVLAAYSNYFRNDFHFDDLTTISSNPAIRHPSTIWLSFFDARLFSVAPAQQSYRPVTTASLALDYWLGGGLNLVFFHLSTFVWYSVQLVLMFLLFERLMNRADPHPSNFWTALVATAAFGLHPANAETVNFIIQRADLYNALGCIASLWLFIRYPSQRKFAWYLLPAAAAMLAKPPAMIFPLLVLAYVLLFEGEDEPVLRKWKSAIRSAAPATALAAAMAYVLARMQPATWNAGAASPFLYRVMQPYVALHYFRTFFLPTGLNVDPHWQYVAPLSLEAIAGYLFVLGMLAVAAAASRTRRGKPVAFGIIWFFVTLLPTSLRPLGDVTNDHRMFFPFVGLTLAVFWSLRLALFHQTGQLTIRRGWVYGSVAALAIVLVAAAGATRARNRVWSTEETLWRDATLKNPRNPKAWTNYGSAFYRQGDYDTALPQFERAAAIDPACPICQANLVRVLMKLDRGPEAEIHLQRLLALHPDVPDPFIAYAGWLDSLGRFEQSGGLLERAGELFPHSPEVRQARLRFYLDRDSAGRMAIFNALDSDHDLALSADEIVAAPAVLATLDANGDGKLSAEECGANFGDESHLTGAQRERARQTFMRSHPWLAALDADHNGEISAREIQNASEELQSLDRDVDGALQASELAPAEVTGVARKIFELLDRNHDSRIDQMERSSEAAIPFRDLLTAADMDQDGTVTLDELVNEVFYRADGNKDGTVTVAEIDAAVRSGVLGPVQRSIIQSGPASL